MIASLFRLTLFFLYLGVLFFLPLSLLWGSVGLTVALTLWGAFLFYLGWNAPVRIARRMGARPLLKAEAPFLFHTNHELCRRGQIAPPQLWIFSSRVPNIAVLGFSASSNLLVVSSEIKNLKRTEQVALMGRAITSVGRGNLLGTTWLSQFLHLLEASIAFSRKSSNFRRESDSLRHFLVQTVLYPLGLVPLHLLGKSKDVLELDRESLLISREPLALVESYRKVEAALNAFPFPVPLSTFHLFIAEPKRRDVLTSVLFKRRSLVQQIKLLNPLKTVTP